MSRPFALAVVVVVPLLVLGWHWLALRQHSRLREVVAELASVREFFGSPAPNHSGSKVFFAQDTDTGIAGYIADTATGKRQYLFEQEQGKLHGVGVSGWSPDDKLLAYTLRTPKGQLVICDGESAKTVGSVNLSQIVAELAWLSPQTLVFAVEKQGMYVVSLSNGTWSGRPFFDRTKVKSKGAPEYLNAMSATSLAWQQGKDIWTCELGSNDPQRIWASTTNTLLDFHYIRAQHAFRLHCRDGDGDFLVSLYPAFGGGPDRLEDMERIVPPAGFSVTDLGFICDGLGYVYRARSPSLDLLIVKTNSSAEPVELRWEGEVENFTANDRFVFANGTATNEPPGIWCYDVNSGDLHSAVSSLDEPFKFARNVTASHGVVTNGVGKEVTYHLWPPANFSREKRYPLVLGFSGFRWRAHQIAIANGGAYFACVRGSTSRDWAGDIFEVYQRLARNPNVDTNKVYLCGISAGVSAANQLMQEFPNLWHGAILFSPVSFPDASRIRVSGILIDSGGNDSYLKDAGGVERLREFQDAAAQAGIQVTLGVHEDASHVYRSLVAERERIQNMMDFLFNN